MSKEIDNILNQIKGLGINLITSKGAEESTIRKVEATLSLCFPSKYRDFLKEYGCIYVGDNIIGGIDNDSIGQGGGTVEYETQHLRKINHSTPKTYACIENDSDEWFVCIDTAKEQCPVLAYDLTSGKFEHVNDDFISYIEEYLHGFLE